MHGASKNLRAVQLAANEAADAAFSFMMTSLVSKHDETTNKMMCQNPEPSEKFKKDTVLPTGTF